MSKSFSLISHHLSLITALDILAVVERRLPRLERDVGFLPGGLAPLEAAAPRLLAHVVDGAHRVHLDVEDALDGRLDLRLRRLHVHAEGQELAAVLRLLLGDERLLGNDRRLDDVPDRSHLPTPPPLPACSPRPRPRRPRPSCRGRAAPGGPRRPRASS